MYQGAPIAWYLLTLSSTPQTSSPRKTSENTEEDPEPADGDIQMEYASA
jgi:hypothetical protein